MIYYIINNDFHIENVQNHISLSNELDFTIIRIPYSLNSDCKSFAENIITIETPFRERKKFWNPKFFYAAKARIDKIPFKEEDLIIFLIEYDPLNQYIVYKSKEKGATIHLLEEGISFYAIYLHDNKLTKSIKYLLKLVYLRYVIGFHFFKYVALGNMNFPQIKDKYIDKILLYFNVEVSRDINVEIISNNVIGYDDLKKDTAVFLSQPLYDSYMSLASYIKHVSYQLDKIVCNYNLVYFKFHPRESDSFKNLIKLRFFNKVIFIDNQNLENFIEEYKPLVAFSFFSDALYRLKSLGLKVRFLYREVDELKNNKYLRNISDIVRRLEKDSEK